MSARVRACARVCARSLGMGREGTARARVCVRDPFSARARARARMCEELIPKTLQTLAEFQFFRALN